MEASQSRPWIIRIIGGYLLLAPLLQVLAAATSQGLANFGTQRAANWPIYGLAAPFVGFLLWKGHPRARFAAYVYLTLETFRGIRGIRLEAYPLAWRAPHLHGLLLAILFVLALQIPSARRYCPSLKPAEVRARLRQRVAFLRKAGG